MARAAGTALTCSGYNSGALSALRVLNLKSAVHRIEHGLLQLPGLIELQADIGIASDGAGASNVSIPVLDLVGNLLNTSAALGAY